MMNEYLDTAMMLEEIISNIDNIVGNVALSNKISANLLTIRSSILQVRNETLELAKLSLPEAPDTIPPPSDPQITLREIDNIFGDD